MEGLLDVLDFALDAYVPHAIVVGAIVGAFLWGWTGLKWGG